MKDSDVMDLFEDYSCLKIHRKFRFSPFFRFKNETRLPSNRTYLSVLLATSVFSSFNLVSQEMYLLREVEIPVQQTISANFARSVVAIFRSKSLILHQCCWMPVPVVYCECQ